MKERPILFSGTMIRAILSGAKTQTRRVIKPQPTIKMLAGEIGLEWRRMLFTNDSLSRFCPYGVAGDRLWVRETWNTWGTLDHIAPQKLPHDTGIAYAADMEIPKEEACGKLRPGMFMPRWASRITVEIVGIRVERVQDIEPSDCRAEGVGYDHQFDSLMPATGWREAFADLWNSINAARGYGWDVNPWVWVIEFRKVTP